MFMVRVPARYPIGRAEFFGPFSTEAAASSWVLNTLSMDLIRNEEYTITSLKSPVEY
jgi:hypothetical protein